MRPVTDLVRQNAPADRKWGIFKGGYGIDFEKRSFTYVSARDRRIFVAVHVDGRTVAFIVAFIIIIIFNRTVPTIEPVVLIDEQKSVFRRRRSLSTERVYVCTRSFL